MMDTLSLNEQEKLKKFRVYFHKERPLNYGSLQQMMNSAGANTYLKTNEYQIGSSLPKVAASLLSKRIAFIAVAHLYTMTVFNATLSSQPKDWALISTVKNGLWILDFYLIEEQIERMTGDRDTWKKEAVQKWFQQLIAPAVCSLCLATGLSKKTVWENIRIYIDWLYLDVLTDPQYNSIQTSVEKDYHWITEPTMKFLGNNHLKNPFAALPRFQRSQRETCCLSHLLDRGAKKCKNCPLSNRLD